MMYSFLRWGAVALVFSFLSACGTGSGHGGAPRAGKHLSHAAMATPLTGERLFANAVGSSLTLTLNGVIGSVKTPAAGPRAGQTVITVNGIRVSVSQATISRGAATLTAASLRSGQAVSVNATLQRGSAVADASEVAVAMGVTGIVEAVDAATGTAQVQGQTVIVDDATEYEGDIAGAEFIGLDQLVEGNVVDVIGTPNEDGTIQAAEVAYLADAFVADEMTIVVTGPVSGLDAEAMNFSINAAAIDYSQAELVDFPVDDAGNPVVTDGQTVTVESTAGLSDSGAVIAAAVRFVAAPLDVTAGSGGTASVDAAGTVPADVIGASLTLIQGRVSAVSGQLIVVNGITVFTGSAPVNNVRANGVQPKITVNSRVTVLGRVGDNGVIVAQDVTVLNGHVAVKLQAPVESYDPDANALTFLGVISVAVTDDTLFEDTTLDDIIAALDAGETPTLEVEADFHEDGSLVAHNIEMEDDEDDPIKLRGPAANIDPDAMSFDILGVVIAVADETVYVLDGADVAAEDFFAALAELGDGATVKAQGDFDAESGTLTAGALVLRTEAADAAPAQAEAAANSARASSAGRRSR